MSNKMDMSCKLLADKKICNPCCHWAIHHQLNYGEPTRLNLKYLINDQHWWFSTPLNV